MYFSARDEVPEEKPLASNYLEKESLRLRKKESHLSCTICQNTYINEIMSPNIALLSHGSAYTVPHLHTCANTIPKFYSIHSAGE